MKEVQTWGERCRDTVVVWSAECSLWRALFLCSTVTLRRHAACRGSSRNTGETQQPNQRTRWRRTYLWAASWASVFGWWALWLTEGNKDTVCNFCCHHLWIIRDGSWEMLSQLLTEIVLGGKFQIQGFSLLLLSDLMKPWSWNVCDICISIVAHVLSVNTKGEGLVSNATASHKGAMLVFWLRF